MTHFLKSWPGAFELVASGRKIHEIRNCSDRTFTEGDDVVFMEWNPAVYEAALRDHVMADRDVIRKAAEQKAFTGHRVLRKIGFVSIPGSWGLPADICVFSLHNYGVIR